MRSEKWYSSLSLALTVWMLTSFSAPYCGGMASGKPSCKGTETPITVKERMHYFIIKGSKIQRLRQFENWIDVKQNKFVQMFQGSSCVNPFGNKKTKSNDQTNCFLPGALGGTGGAVQAALWQRPAEICRIFFPCRTVIRVGSLTWLVWPSPSWQFVTDGKGTKKNQQLWKYF